MNDKDLEITYFWPHYLNPNPQLPKQFESETLSLVFHHMDGLYGYKCKSYVYVNTSAEWHIHQNPWMLIGKWHQQMGSLSSGVAWNGYGKIELIGYAMFIIMGIWLYLTNAKYIGENKFIYTWTHLE